MTSKKSNNQSQATIKTAKLQPEDRVKLIDRPDLLVVIPKTHAAAVRYGNATSWCTSVVKCDYHFKLYNQNGFLVYIIYYVIDDDNQRQERSKIALAVKSINNSDIFKIQGYTEKNGEIDKGLLEKIILTQEIKEAIKAYHAIWVKNKYGFTIGSEIVCKNLSSPLHKIPVLLNGDYWALTVYINPCDIRRCVVTSINEYSIRADIKELKLRQPLTQEIHNILLDHIAAGKVNVNLKHHYISKT